jgi:phenylalanine-4-hydroxylase
MNPVATLTVAEPYLIRQDWEAYTPEQHAVWADLVRRRMPQLHQHACREYLDGFDRIGLREDSIPNLAEVNKRLGPRTGWNATPVSGFLPPDAFFEMLAARQFPTTTWLRSRDSLEYTPEPDIFHDVFGHVPMHAHPVFADFLQHYGKVCARLTDSARGTAKDKLERMGRLFWFTVEFGVIRQNGEIKLYGSGLISSHGESTYVIEGIKNGGAKNGAKGSHGPEIRDFNLDQVLDQQFLVSEMQKVLYAVESFDQIYEAARQAEERLL